MEDVLRIFAQRSDTRTEIDAWRRNAERFFGARLELADATLVVDGEPRRLRGRPRDDADLRDALEAEKRAGTWGLYDLARRCETVWTIERRGPGDRAALLGAAALASVLLGPILADGELFGVRTARTKLEALASP